MNPARYENAKWEDVPKPIADLVIKMPNTRRGIYIHGDVGTGKTHIAYAIKAHYDDKDMGRFARFWNTTELLREIRADFDRDRGERMRPEQNLMENKNLVILDDVGSEKISDWVAETFYLIVNKRYNQMLPTIFTSNLSTQELSERIGDRTVSRIVEMCDVVELVGVDRRVSTKPRIKVQINP